MYVSDMDVVGTFNICSGGCYGCRRLLKVEMYSCNLNGWLCVMFACCC